MRGGSKDTFLGARILTRKANRIIEFIQIQILAIAIGVHDTEQLQGAWQEGGTTDGHHGVVDARWCAAPEGSVQRIVDEMRHQVYHANLGRTSLTAQSSC